MKILREPWVWLLMTAALFCACSTAVNNSATSNTSVGTSANSSANTSAAGNTSTQDAGSGAKIPIDPGGPADTVKAFYAHLRAKRFREAIFLTNLRPAVEGLTDTELKDFAVDFESLAGEVPAEIEI